MRQRIFAHWSVKEKCPYIAYLYNTFGFAQFLQLLHHAIHVFLCNNNQASFNIDQAQIQPHMYATKSTQPD